MARPRTATNVLELKGAFKKNPDRGRARADEPEPTKPLGSPPKALSADPLELEAWETIVSEALPGVLGNSDRRHVEILAKLIAMTWRTPIEEMSDGKLSRIDSMLGKLGMNPSERSKVKGHKAAPKNSFLED